LRKRVLISIAAVIVAVAAGWWWLSAGTQSTDDAQVDGYVVPIAGKVGGILKEVRVENNQRIEAGALLAVIDPRDFEATLARAEADLREAQAALLAAEARVPVTSATVESELTSATAGRGNAEAAIAVSEREVDAAKAKLAAARARQREAEANLTKTTQDVQRLRPLAEKDEVSRQQFDATVASQQAAQASVDSAIAAVAEAETAVAAQLGRLTQTRGILTQAASVLSAARTAPQQVAAARAQVASAQARVGQAEATLRRAKLDVDYTQLRAPSAGIVSRITAKPGQIVQPGQPLMALVPIDEIWITANFKETQLASMRVGQPADIEVDAYRGRRHKGRVDSVAPATGARFSLLPPENASGNYVKVVQRIPVRIVLDTGQDPEHLLRPGMSVVVSVATR
jgi:membrane fusion protein (multidrug efflux system)